MRVGVLALQGDFERHLESVQRAGAEAVEVRNEADLASVQRLIIPGGESTTVGMLLRRTGLETPLRNAYQAGLPIWGTCMGMILMAREIEGRPDQFSLGFLDVVVRRNAFGAQVHSFEDTVRLTGLADGVTGVFIRAPIVTAHGSSVRAIGEYDGKVVAVRSGKCLGTSFHPELTDDTRLHAWFLSSEFDEAQ
jgi:5'-phosphate synthase pdxT subunit